MIVISTQPLVCHADGCFIGKYTASDAGRTRNMDITEPNQNALISYMNETELLVIQAKYKGATSEFLWLVPTPTKPSVRRANKYTFDRLHQLTAPRIKYWMDLKQHIHERSIFNKTVPSMARGIHPVEVIMQDHIGIYDITVLAASESYGLIKWLNVNGYPVPNKVYPVIANYIKRGWFFTAMRINKDSGKGWWKNKEEGLLEPIAFEFFSDKPVYPLNISSLNHSNTEILLYFVGNYSVGYKHMQSEYNQRRPAIYKSEEIEHFFLSQNNYTNANDLYLTKLRGTFKPEDMNQDIILRPIEYFAKRTVLYATVLDNLGLLLLYMLSVMLKSPILIGTIPVALMLCFYRKMKQHMKALMISIVLVEIVMITVIMCGYTTELNYKIVDYVHKTHDYSPFGIGFIVFFLLGILVFANPQIKKNRSNRYFIN